MSPSPPLTPGCMVMWLDNSDRWQHAMVIQFEEDRHHGYFTLMIIKNERITDLTLLSEELDSRWRVLHAQR